VDLPIEILVADDDDLCREILRDAIESKGVIVSLAADGAEALALLRSKAFDILITDLNMPRMDGLTLLRNARQLYPQLLAIIITGFGSLESAIEAIRAGAYDYVQKPFKIEEITVTLRNATERIVMLREKTWLLRELEEAHQKLRQLRPDEFDHDISLPATSEEALPSAASFYLFPRRSLPLSFLETPLEGSPSSVLSELERLKELKQGRVINEEEFERLKKMIINKIKIGSNAA